MFVNIALAISLLLSVGFFGFGSNGHSKVIGFVWLIICCAAFAERFA